MAAKMDAWGETCRDHMEEIVAVMEQEAMARGWRIPTILMRGGMRGVVEMAILKAKL